MVVIDLTKNTWYGRTFNIALHLIAIAWIIKIMIVL